jgi:XrtJ-associated TM-motif-TM protein
MKKYSYAFLGFALIFTTLHLHAQGPSPDITGCVDSPENPTAVLAIVGSAGALLATARNRIRARRAARQK